MVFGCGYGGWKQFLRVQEFSENDISGLFLMIVRIRHTFCSFTC